MKCMNFLDISRWLDISKAALAALVDHNLVGVDEMPCKLIQAVPCLDTVGWFSKWIFQYSFGSWVGVCWRNYSYSGTWSLRSYTRIVPGHQVATCNAPVFGCPQIAILLGVEILVTQWCFIRSVIISTNKWEQEHVIYYIWVITTPSVTWDYNRPMIGNP